MGKRWYEFWLGWFGLIPLDRRQTQMALKQGKLEERIDSLERLQAEMIAAGIRAEQLVDDIEARVNTLESLSTTRRPIYYR